MKYIYLAQMNDKIKPSIQKIEVPDDYEAIVLGEFDNYQMAKSFLMGKIHDQISSLTRLSLQISDLLEEDVETVRWCNKLSS